MVNITMFPLPANFTKHVEQWQQITHTRYRNCTVCNTGKIWRDNYNRGRFRLSEHVDT